MSELYEYEEETKFWNGLWSGDMVAILTGLAVFGPNHVFTDREDVDLTPIMISACTNNTELLHLLLRAGSHWDTTCSEYARFYHNKDVLDLVKSIL